MVCFFEMTNEKEGHKWSWGKVLLNVQRFAYYTVILGKNAKGEFQNGGKKETKHAKFFEKQIFFTPGKKCLFFGKFGVLCFFYLRFETHFLLSPSPLKMSPCIGYH